uniref:Uncharacterized protein n=1 Tax=Nomascus leucogenys TaxID=61853 RepID=A0A2I3GCB4_NOMLE
MGLVLPWSADDDSPSRATLRNMKQAGRVGCVPALVGPVGLEHAFGARPTTQCQSQRRGPTTKAKLDQVSIAMAHCAPCPLKTPLCRVCGDLDCKGPSLQVWKHLPIRALSPCGSGLQGAAGFTALQLEPSWGGQRMGFKGDRNTWGRSWNSVA